MPLIVDPHGRRRRGLPALGAGSAHRLVAGLGQERRRLGVAEHGEIHGPRGGPVDRAHLEPADTQRVVGAGEEVQILARGIEGRRGGVREAVGDLVRALLGDRVKEDRAQVAVEALGVRDPLRVGRPHRVEAPARVVVGVGVELHGARRWPRRSPTGRGGCPRAAVACRRVTRPGWKRTPSTASAIVRGFVTPVCSAIVS